MESNNDSSGTLENSVPGDESETIQGNKDSTPNKTEFDVDNRSPEDIIKDDDKDVTMTQELADGTDSGVEVAVRALSSNGSNSDRITPAQSCGSSLVSCYSEPEVDRGSDCGSESSNRSHAKKISENPYSKKSRGTGKTLSAKSRINRKVSDCDGRRTSESCSETSSTYEAQTSTQSSRSTDFNRTVSSRLYDAKKSDPTKASVVRRADSSTREKLSSRSQSNVRTVSSSAKPVPRNRSAKPTTAEKEVKTNKSKPDNDDGRWPSSAQKVRSRCPSAVDTARSKNSSSNTMSSSTISANSMSSSFGSSNVKSNALDKYGTLPRRAKKREAEQVEIPAPAPTPLPRSNSVSREPSLNRAATLRRQQSKEKDGSCLGNVKSLPPYPRGRRSAGKTLIYHEVNVQTTLTSEDIGNALAGIPIPDRDAVPVVEKVNKAVQSEGKERVKKMEESYLKQCEELEKEKKEKEALNLEIKNMNIRICKMLGYSDVNCEGVGEKGLNELEQHFQAVGLTVIKQQEELTELRHFKAIAQRDLERSFAAQKNLLQQQQEIEAEYCELHEFLQAEKSTLSESLHDVEEEAERLKKELALRSASLEQQQAECKHLVRICEQRRQENLSLEAKLSGLEQRSRDVLLQQGAAVSGAAVALSGLGARLDSLVEQLAVSYNVSEKDLEDVIFHNEAYTQSQSEDNSPDYPPPQPAITDLHASPKRGASFLHAIVGAIYNATQSPFASGKKSPPMLQADERSDSLLDSEMEPCLVLDTVFEEDSALFPNYVDSKQDDGSDETITLVPQFENKASKLCHSDSLQNLSAAILARQQVEQNERTLSPDSAIPIEVNSLVDQVIDVDNLVTKLLKVLRIVQLENDACVDQLHDQRVDLAEKVQQEQVYRQRTEDSLQRLQHELKEARCQLNARIMQLEEAKAMLTENWRAATAETQRQYATIDHALETLHSIQGVVDQYPPLVKLQQDLEECNFRTASGDDLNANSARNGNVDNSVVKEVKHNGTVLTTAI